MTSKSSYASVFVRPQVKEKSVFSKISTSAFLDSKRPFTYAPKSAKIQKKITATTTSVDGRFKQRAKIHFQKIYGCLWMDP